VLAHKHAQAASDIDKDSVLLRNKLNDVVTGVATGAVAGVAAGEVAVAASRGAVRGVEGAVSVVSVSRSIPTVISRARTGAVVIVLTPNGSPVGARTPRETVVNEDVDNTPQSSPSLDCVYNDHETDFRFDE
jgi:hypothetical protein